MRYKLVIFDFDGTLADSFAWFVGVFNDAADRYAFRRIDERELDVLRGYSGRRMMRHAGTSPWKLPFVASYVRKQSARYAAQVSLFPGVGGLLRRLSGAGVAVAVVSSNSEENVRLVMGPENAALVRHYECGASLFGKKASFRRVLRRSGAAPGEALAVGDEIRDLEAARAAGIPFGAVSWGYTTPEALRAHAPAELFEEMEQIADAAAGVLPGAGAEAPRPFPLHADR